MRPPTRKLALALTVVSVLAFCSAATAHEGDPALGLRSKITRVKPTVPGLTIVVLDLGDRIRLVNKSGKTVQVLGYESEPYLSFRSGGVYRNVRSAATYLNDDRYGQVKLPAAVNPKAPPVWKRVATGNSYEWHDHRVHWMSTSLPPKVAEAKEKAQHVFDWTVPVRVGTTPLTVFGSLDYQPPK